jgi:uncharacterized protein
MKQFKYYLLIGGLSDAIDEFLNSRNLVNVRNIQTETMNFYKADSTKYDRTTNLPIRKVYDLIPSTLENKKNQNLWSIKTTLIIL